MGGFFSSEEAEDEEADTAERHAEDIRGQTTSLQLDGAGLSEQSEPSYRKLWCCLNLPRQDCGWHGVHVPVKVNSLEPTRIETENFRGHILFLHRPLEEGHPWPYGKQFEGKSRVWELRVQGVFISDPGDIHFAVELEKPMTLSWASQVTMNMIMAFAHAMTALRGVVFDYNLFHEERDDGDVILPYFSCPLAGADVVLQTPQGASPPPLTEPFEKMTPEEKMAVELNTTDTFTFLFWTNRSDFLRWELVNLPLGLGDKMEVFHGPQPINFVVYRKRPGVDRSPLTVRDKDYLFRLVIHRENHEELDASPESPVRLASLADASKALPESCCCFPWLWR
mmetsp:Transcript_13110/g.31182  ORF Transcript_13110/g.31182 Transcript_13110/m.31182 type:complete len:338 (-) Transcript_13110:34-1047(-)